MYGTSILGRVHQKVVWLWFVAILLLVFGQLSAMAANPTVLRYVDWASGLQQETMKQIFADFEKANPDIKVEYLSIPWVNQNDYLEKVTVMVVGGAAPDVIQAVYNGVPQMAESGMLLPIDKLISRDSREVNPNDFVPIALEATSWKGQIYGLPYDLSLWWVNYNADAFANAGLANPSQLYDRKAWTWQAMEESARKITKRGPDGNTQVYGFFTYADGMYPWLWGYGGDLVSQDGKRSRFGDAESIAGIERMRQLMYEERTMAFPSWSGIPNMPDYDSIVTPGNFGMMPWWITIVAGYRDSKVRWQYDQVPFPPGPKDPTTNPASIHTIAIMQGSQQTEAAWRLVKYITGTGYKRVVQNMGWGALRKSLLPLWAEYMAKDHVTGLKFFDDGIARTKLLPRGSTMAQVDSIVRDGLNPIWRNTAAPQSVMTQLSKRIDSILGN